MGSKRRSRDESICGNFSSIELIMCGDMLFEVLIRLPVKVLFRFKVVSHQWYSLISDPSFARSYVAQASLSPQRQWILISCFARKPIVEPFFRKKLPLRDCSLGMNRLDLLTVHSHSHSRKSKVSCKFSDMVVGISNGLLLYGPLLEDFREGRNNCYDIYNPMTGGQITLPPRQRGFANVTFTGFVTQIKDNVLESYRVMRIDADYRNRHRSLRYEVYFSEIHEWVYYTVDLNQDAYFDKWQTSVVIDKILLWIYIVRGYILAFDLYKKPDSIRLISLPVDSGRGGGGAFGHRYNLFDEHQGHLRYFELLRGRSNEFSLSLWKLIDYDMGEWFLEHKVIIDNFQCDGDGYLFLRPLSLHPFGSDIVYMRHHEGSLRCVLSYDFNARELKTVDEARQKDLFRLADYTPSVLFVVPPWPVSVNSSPRPSRLPPKTD